MRSRKPRLSTDVEIPRDGIHRCPGCVLLRDGGDGRRREGGGGGDGLSSSLLRMIDPSLSVVVHVDGSRSRGDVRRVVDVDRESHGCFLKSGWWLGGKR